MTKLDRILSRHGVTTISLVRETQAADPEKKGYSRTYVYGIRRGAIVNPTRRCMAVILAATRKLVDDPTLQINDLFEFAEASRRKAS